MSLRLRGSGYGVRPGSLPADPRQWSPLSSVIQDLLELLYSSACGTFYSRDKASGILSPPAGTVDPKAQIALQ
jgi:hypothetical protein